MCLYERADGSITTCRATLATHVSGLTWGASAYDGRWSPTEASRVAWKMGLVRIDLSSTSTAARRRCFLERQEQATATPRGRPPAGTSPIQIDAVRYWNAVIWRAPTLSVEKGRCTLESSKPVSGRTPHGLLAVKLGKGLSATHATTTKASRLLGGG